MSKFICVLLYFTFITYVTSVSTNSNENGEKSCQIFRNEIEKDLLQLKEELAKTTENLQKLNAAHEKLQRDHNNLQKLVGQDPVPIGFIYTQLPDQAAPYELWPLLTWTNISPLYAGDFFRVVGGNSAPFGSSQGESFPRISGVEFIYGDSSNWWIDLPGQGWSPVVLSGDVSGEQDSGLKFHVQSNPNFPANKAVKIWRRTA